MSSPPRRLPRPPLRGRMRSVRAATRPARRAVLPAPPRGAPLVPLVDAPSFGLGCRRKGGPPFQLVYADFPHMVYRWATRRCMHDGACARPSATSRRIDPSPTSEPPGAPRFDCRDLDRGRARATRRSDACRRGTLGRSGSAARGCSLAASRHVCLFVTADHLQTLPLGSNCARCAAHRCRSAEAVKRREFKWASAIFRLDCAAVSASRIALPFV